MSNPREYLLCSGCGKQTPISQARVRKHCAYCAQIFVDSRFEAHGGEAMTAQTEIVQYHLRMAMIRTVAAYSISAIFAIIAAMIVIFAPESRGVAANLFAGAFLVLALGIAGFTRFLVKAPGLEISGTSQNSI